MNPNLAKHASSELLILIRGGKRTGKTSLLKRMSGRPFSEEYEPSTITQTTTIKWRPQSGQSNIVSITLLDVVSMNPHLTTTAHGSPQGIIVMYDPRDSESVNYAVQVIENVPMSIPISLLTNFQDLITADLHPLLRPFTNRCYPISSSMITNLGLSELSHWLELPLSLNIFSAYSKLLNYSNKETVRLKSMFAPGNTSRILNLNSKKDEDDGFWSDDDRNSFQMYSNPNKLRQINNSLPDIQPMPELAEPSMVNEKDDDLMRQIIQTASSTKTVIGKDEIEFDNQKKNPLAMVNLTMNSSQKLGNQSEKKRHHHSSSKSSGERRKHHHKSSKKEEITIPQFPAIQLNSSSNNTASTMSNSDQVRQLKMQALGYPTTSVQQSNGQVNHQVQIQQQQQLQQQKFSGYDMI